MSKKDSVYLGEMEAGESLTARMRAVHKAVRERFPNMPNTNTWADPKEVFDDAVVVYYEGAGQPHLYALGYDYADGVAKLGDDMLELTEETYYEIKKAGSRAAALKAAATRARNRGAVAAGEANVRRIEDNKARGRKSAVTRADNESQRRFQEMWMRRKK